MCGIAGILHFNRQPVNPADIAQITNAMQHRGPDAANCITEDELGLGHRRLSIIDLSAAANQPFTDNSGRYVMVYNGEMYNFMEVKLLLQDYQFQTSSDTEVLIAAFSKWGPLCIRHFKGMFAFAIWDRQEKELTVMRDRLGVKPLYYYIDNERFIFASEIRAILASGKIKRTINKAALTELFSYQSIGYPLSAIEGIKQLEAGTSIRVKNGQIDKQVYWDVTIPKNEGFDFKDGVATKKHIRQLLAKSVERRLVSDVPVGAFLSGGIDSSAIVGLMAETGNASPNTFTVGFTEKEFDESEYAGIVAKKFNTRHTNLLLKPTVFLDEMENALNAMDSPSADGINTYVVSKAIRNAGITVALSGIGGDELFAGYPFFKQYLKLQEKKNLYRGTGLLRRMTAAMLSGNSNRKKRMQQIIQAPSPAVEYMYPVSRQILSPGLIQQLTSFNDFDMQDTALFRQLHSKHNNIVQFPLLSQVSIADYLGYTQHTLLKDTDQMSMAVSLEVREPFFDHELIEFVLSIPDKLKFPAYPKSLLVESLQPLLPDEIVHRKKQGFVFPWNEWMKNELRSFCEQRLQRLGQRSFINSKSLDRYWKRFLANDPSVRWSELWMFVVLEHWMEKNNIQE
ncbi:MAG: asparagine synthase (glutamine-hydrolyzing) [Bacteroidota bacterium]